VAGVSSNVTTVATNIANVNTVAGNNANVTTVAGISANVTTVAGISANVTTVAGISSDVSTVSTNNANVTTVATNIASVNTNATNIVAIQNASTNATNAANSATAAANSATAAQSAQTSAEAALASFNATYLGAQASDPTLDNEGDPVTAGDWYFNTASNISRIYDGASWSNVTVSTATVVSKTSGTGSAVMPSGTTGQRDGSPTSGYLRFNTTLTKFEGYNGSAWSSVGGGATGGGNDDIFIENGQTVTTNYTITNGKNAGTFGPVSIDSGVTVTVPTGSVWTIV